MFEKFLFRSAAAVATLMLLMSTAAAVEIETVPVANLGNDPDTRYATPGYGGVDYAYNMGTYEVSNAEYTEFLNVVNPDGSDPYGLYNSSMGSSNYGGITYTDGNPNGSKYDVKPSRGDKPVNYVSFWDGCRFANWLHNGQVSGGTETGAYTLTSDGITNNTVTRNADWLWAVTSEDEWYKAAYYDGGSDVYYNYPTGSNTAPTAQAPPGISTLPGSANYNGVVGDLTDVGAYTAKPSDSPYETFDQGGNVWEWNEAIIGGSCRGLRGGSFNYIYNSGYLRAPYRCPVRPTNENSHSGFRVASIPEPGSITLLVCGAVAGLIWWRRRK